MSRPSAPLLFVVTVALVAVGWRLVGLTDWPARWYASLQYESALAARTIWVAVDPRDPDREAWLRDTGTLYVTSPPVLPALVAAIYLVTGEEAPWVSRLFTIPLWLAAGGFAAGAAVRLTGSHWAGAAAFAWFVLCPFGMLMSRSFQTESVLACAFAAAIWLLARPGWDLSWRRTLVAGLVCGVAGFVKPGVLFLPLLAGYAAVVLPAPGSMRRKGVHLAAFVTLLVLPGTVYAVTMLRQHAGRVMPHLLGERWFYEGVAENVWDVVGPAGVAGLVGVATATRAGKYLPLALLGGHATTLAVFTYHAATHDYYQAPLMVVTAIALGWPAAWVERWVAKRNANRAAVAAGLAAAVAGYLAATPDPDVGPWRWTPEARAELEARAARRRARAETAAAVVAAVGPRAHVIELTEGYGYPLQYHGWLRTLKWPSAADRFYLTAAGGEPPFSADAYFRHMTASGEWQFFVVADNEEWGRQPDLRAVLEARGPPWVEQPGLLIYDLRRP